MGAEPKGRRAGKLDPGNHEAGAPGDHVERSERQLLTRREPRDGSIRIRVDLDRSEVDALRFASRL